MAGAGKVVDIRHEIIEIFEKIMTTYLLGRDVSNKIIATNVLKSDGSIVKEDLKLYKAFMASFEFAVSNASQKYFLGERAWTKSLKANADNFENFYKLLDDIVAEQWNLLQ